MSWNAHFNKRTAITTICICLIALIFIANNAKIDFKSFTLRSSYCVQAIHKNLILKNCRCKHAADMEECRKFLTVYNLSQENKGNYTCITMKVVPPTKVCLHDLKTDIWVSRVIAQTRAWERETLSEFKDELLKDDKLGVLDMGANIGVYTLYAATMGRKVVSVEPFIKNVQRLHKAAILGGVKENIVLLQNAVADKRDEVMLKLSSDNQGLTSVIQKKTCNNKTCPPTIKTLLLSDLRYIATFDRAIMKIDIQGFEPRAFTTIEPLLDQISIPVIFMKWEFFHPVFKGRLDHESVQNMIQVLTKRGYLPYHLRENKGKLLNIELHQSWPYNIVWRRNTTKVQSIRF